MKPSALVAALIAAAVGALAWGALGAFTGHEAGIVAWGIGALVGFAAHRAGGEGAASGVGAAIFAVLAIFAGKALVVELGAPREIRAMADELLPAELYVEMQQDAADWREVDEEDPAAVAAFMVAHGYTEAGSAEEITSEERQGFLEGQAPLLDAMAAEGWSEEEWRERSIDAFSGGFLADYSWLDRIKDSLGPFDLLWILLGVTTAWRIGAQAQPDERFGDSPLQTGAGHVGPAPSHPTGPGDHAAPGATPRPPDPPAHRDR